MSRKGTKEQVSFACDARDGEAKQLGGTLLGAITNTSLGKTGLVVT